MAENTLTKKYRKWTGYSLPYATSGGIAKAAVRALAKMYGIPVRDEYTIYAGHFGVKVPTVLSKQFERKVLRWNK